MDKIIIAIDGHSSCGKSSTAKALAKMIGYGYIDTGAMYRAVTLYFQEHNIDLDDAAGIAYALGKITIDFRFSKENNQNEVFLNDENVENRIRTLKVASMVSNVATIAAVRHKLVTSQQDMGRKRGVIMDGRDIGTNVFPQAELKVFMTASAEVRAERRLKELHDRGDVNITFEKVKNNLEERDFIDSNRKENPLKTADDAVVLDTSSHTFESQVQWIKERYDILIEV